MSDNDQSLAGRIATTRRKFLGAIGAGAGVASVGSALEGDDQDPAIQSGGMKLELTQQYKRGQYVTAPKSAFDPDALQPGEWYHLQDGEVGIKNEDGGVDQVPIGSTDNPAPAINSEQGNITKLSTDDLNNGTVRRLDPSNTESDWQTVIDEVSAAGGGTVIPEPGTYVGVITLKDGVTLDCLSFRAAAFKLPDSTSKTGPVINIEDGATDWAIRNVEVDGNAANNSGSFDDGNTNHGISVEDTDNNNRPSDGEVENVYVHDTIRSCVLASGKDCSYENLWLENSATDHLLYVARGIDQDIGTVYASGKADQSSVTFGTSGYECTGNSIQKVVFSDPQAPDSGSYPKYSVEFRNDGTCKNNVVEDLVMDYDSSSDGQAVKFASANVVGNLIYDGPYSASPFGPIMMLNQQSERAKIKNAEINITSTSKAEIKVIYADWDDWLIESPTIRESTSATVVGASIEAGGNEDITNAKIANPDMSVSGKRINMEGGTELIDLELEGVYDPSGIQNIANPDDFLRGTMLPQRLNDMSGKSAILWDGRLEFNDGGDGNTVGPAYWDASAGNWVSVVDGTTWV